MVSDAAKAESYKARQATKLRVPVVHTDFLEACEKEGRLVEADDFLLAGTTPKKDFQSGKIAGGSFAYQAT